MLTITAFYAALLGLVYIALAGNVFGYRRRHHVALGHGDDPVLERRIRAHGNFAEYAPFILLLIGFAEAQGGVPWLIHGLCAALVIGRAIHAVGISRANEDYRLRATGMALTLTSCGAASVVNLWLSTLG